MHNPCSSPYFKSESHQMKLALWFQRRILLVFLPGRKGKPFQTFSLIQNSKNLSSLWLKGKAVPGLGKKDHSSVQQHSPPSRPHPTGLGPPISRGINDAFLTQDGTCPQNCEAGQFSDRVLNYKVKIMGVTPRWTNLFSFVSLPYHL